VAADLHIRDLRFRFGPDQPWIFDGIDLRVPGGSVTALVGRSGCGKSTLLRLAAGLLTPEGGGVHDGRRPGENGDTGFVFQAPTLLPWRSVAANVALPLELSGRADEAAAKVPLALASVGLAQDADRLPGALSGGMQMRVSLARALVTHPALLLMDEPFGALDALTRREAWAVVQQVWAQAGATVLLVTHDIDEAVLLADRVVVLAASAGQPARIAGVVEVDRGRPRRADDRFAPQIAHAVARVEACL
jgi:NitT/TauT family transport system ATP-binding protein